MCDKISFTKMHGLGNDFVLLDCREGEEYDFPTLAVRMCDRHRGVGADGLLIVLQSDKADARMRIFNSDGTEAQMCGNGIRCVGKHIYDTAASKPGHLTIETLAGLKELAISRNPSNAGLQITVDMGPAVFTPQDIPARVDELEMVEYPIHLPQGDFKVIGVSMGNPHGVVFVENLAAISVGLLGPQLECHPLWPEKANIEFVEKMGEHKIRQFTWERGVGETEACGTGACAAAAAAVKTGRCTMPVTVLLKGGDLVIDTDSDTGNILMTGPAETVFHGNFIQDLTL